MQAYIEWEYSITTVGLTNTYDICVCKIQALFDSQFSFSS